jgi:ribosomal protein L11 methyltransferase (prmA)
MVKLSATITDAIVQPLEDAFCELTRSNWGIEKINDRLPPELFGYFDSEKEASEAYAEIRGRFPNLPDKFSLENINDCDWQNEYKKFLKPWSYNDLHWVPVWMRGEYKVPDGDKALYFDAGLAFGTGDHPTTRLCAMSMLDYARQNDVAEKFIVDAGCGSGILALTAKLYGFGKIYGFDRDEEAVRVSKENARFNDIPLANVVFEHAGIEKALAGKKADIVLANIISDVLCIYADVLIGAVKDGGWLVLSGILAVENDKVRDYFISCGGDRFASIEGTPMGEWSRLEIKMKG